MNELQAKTRHGIPELAPQCNSSCNTIIYLGTRDDWSTTGLLHIYRDAMLANDRHADTANVVDPSPRRQPTDTTAIDSTITHPGSVKINVQGAFIVNEEPSSIETGTANHHDTKDIRLPNHTAVVSHIAVDVSGQYPSQPLRLQTA